MDTNNRKGILWFRNDLRLHDNEALHDALRHGERIYPIYVFDSRVFMGKTKYGFRKTELFRSQFILESVAHLREALRSKGSDLIIRIGRPEEIIAELAKEIRTHWVFCNRERTQEELIVQDRLEQSLWAIGQEIRYSRGKMLYYTSDLPFPVTHTPDTYTQFRKEVEKITPIRAPLATPEILPALELNEEFDLGKIPSLEDFGFSESEIAKLQDDRMKGGEQEGLSRLNYYLWESDLVANYKQTRNGLLGTDYSSRLSIHLSQGSLSPKMVYYELKRYEEERVANDSTHHFFLELLWRDFFRLMGKKHGNSIFKEGGIRQIRRHDLKEDETVFRIWAEGRTGIPFVDAAMVELNTSTWLSKRNDMILMVYMSDIGYRS